jgi:signal transduction histidine kinase
MIQVPSKYIYPLVGLSIVISLLLQAAWLSQLFKDEKARIVVDLEQITAVASKENIYATLDKRYTNNPALNRFFLSPIWVDIWQGFENFRDPSLYKSFDVNPQRDSTTLTFRLIFLQRPPEHRKAPRYGMGYTAGQMKTLDNMALQRFKRSIDTAFSKLDLPLNHTFLVYPFFGKNPATAELRKADFVSEKYGYNLLHLNAVQVSVDSVAGLVWYKMRYYLISAVLMTALTGIAFYFVISLMNSRRLYADARLAFTSNMTHEIKTPIATVALALESIGKYNLIDDPEKMQRYLNMGKQELQRLSHLVERVLNLSEENGEMKLSPVFYDVQAGLSDVIQSMELPLQNAGAHCELIVSPEPCFIEGDALHLSAVFFNLIENAIKYAVEPLKLLITCTADKNYVTINFTDNGPGISQIYKDKIFERFFRIPQPGHTYPVKGSGLGLHYVRGVIERHKGIITLKSEEGAGSTFIIKLPVASNEL